MSKTKTESVKCETITGELLGAQCKVSVLVRDPRGGNTIRTFDYEIGSDSINSIKPTKDEVARMRKMLDGTLPIIPADEPTTPRYEW